MTRIALIPLDERPVNTRYPQMLGDIIGAQILLPPREIMGGQRVPTDPDVVGAWLRRQVENGAVDSAVVSCDFLGYGNLINARISNDSVLQVMRRLSVLDELNERVPVHAFSLITRVANANENREEPEYWGEWGMQFHAFARLTHRAEKQRAGDQSAALSDNEEAELADLLRRLPRELLADWLNRRLRNHAVNLSMINLAAGRKLTSLLLTSDDTSPHGFSSRERDWLRSWVELAGRPSNIGMHPGADEVGSALVTQLANKAAAITPRVWTEYSTLGGEENVAPYEDRPVRETIAGQIEACGCVAAANLDECDFVLGVVTPSPRRADYRPEFLAQDRTERSDAYDSFLKLLGAYQAAGMPVALADVAYPNGSDPLMSEMLLSRSAPLQPGQLAAYGAWNTAGNTLGTVVAQAACSLHIKGDSTRAVAQKLFLAHRFVEDYGYQQVVRRLARSHADERWGRREPDAHSEVEQAEICGFIQRQLVAILDGLHEFGVGVGLSIAPGSVRLPWRRLFEVDFDLVAND